MKALMARFPRLRRVQFRMTLAVSVLLCLLVAVIWRAHHVHAEQGDELVKKSERQTNREMKLKARRGSVRDRNGTLLAVSVEVSSIYANPRVLEDKDGALEQLIGVLGEEVDKDRVRRRLHSGRGFVWIARRVPPTLGARVKELKLPGVGITAESQRFYPLKERAGHLMGFVGGDDYSGLEGLERAFDDRLSGGEYSLPVTTDSRGRRMYTGEAPEFTTLEGQSIVLTIDERLQYIAETELAHGLKRAHAPSGSVIVSDPRTGEILAMASGPQFNPNLRSEYQAIDWRNRPVLDNFEPGSIFKVVTLASALQEGSATLDDRFDINRGKLKIGDDTIRDSHATPHRWVSVRHIIKHSSNIGAYRIARTQSRATFGNYIGSFGFGERTGMPIPEGRGRVREPSKWPEVTFANVAFGQGLTVTNLQMNLALGAIANGGELMKPLLVKEIVDRNGETVEAFAPEVRHRVLSPEVATKTAEVMMSVVEEGGTGTAAGDPNFKVAGKTGTAHKVDPRTRQYSKRLYTASFVGFVPADNPALVITVVINVERDWRGQDYSGGSVAAPIFARVSQQSLPLVGVLPTQKRPTRAVAAAAPRKVSAKVSGEINDRTEQPPPAEIGISRPMAVAADAQLMPSYLGKSLREALSISNDQGHRVQVHGSGWVQGQWPGPGTIMGDDDTVHLRLAGRD
jgi:cell division protein FtsI (penicillin-binding protein 3)